MKPNFEHVEENHEFHVEDEVYLIDKNKVDIFKGKIDKINKKGFIVSFTDHDDHGPKTVLSPKRLLLLTPTNNEIYAQQQEIRMKIIQEKEEAKEMEKVQEQIEESENKNEENDAEDQPDKKEETENSNDNDQINTENGNNDDQINAENGNDDNESNEIVQTKSPKRVKKRRKAKKPIFDQRMIIKTAWHNGIHEVTQFKRYVKKNVKLLVSEFEKYHVMMNAVEEPPFSLGLNLSDSEITKFWTTARNQWKKMFDDAESVDTDEFIRKTAAAFRLQNQMESNARAALQFFFDTDSPANNETNFFQFCALLALFGPTQTMFRKIGHFLQCPSCLKDLFSYTDVADIKEPDDNTCLNEFVFFAGTNHETYVYNMPFTTTDEQYIIDEEGNKYDSWLKVFEHIISEKVEEEAVAINSPPPVPIEA